jgi:hypothetical protein
VRRVSAELLCIWFERDVEGLSCLYIAFSQEQILWVHLSAFENTELVPEHFVSVK